MKQTNHKTTKNANSNVGCLLSTVQYSTIKLFCVTTQPPPQTPPSFRSHQPSSFVANHPASKATQILAEHLDIPTNMG